MTKPEGLTPSESWSWDVSEPGSFARRALVFGKALQAQQESSPLYRYAELMQDMRHQMEVRGYYVPSADLTARARARSPLFVRFGDCPEGGRSTTYRQRLAELGMGDLAPSLRRDFEPGVCVFRARWGDGGELILDVSESPAVAQAARIFPRMGRPVYLATGRRSGSGRAGSRA